MIWDQCPALPQIHVFIFGENHSFSPVCAHMQNGAECALLLGLVLNRSLLRECCGGWAAGWVQGTIKV